MLKVVIRTIALGALGALVVLLGYLRTKMGVC